jgi:hypothetical protein
MPRSINRESIARRAEKIAKDAFFEPADMASGREKQRKRYGALRTMVGDEAAAKESPFLKFDAGDTPMPKANAGPASGGKEKFQARGGRVKKASGGRVKTFFSSY